MLSCRAAIKKQGVELKGDNRYLEKRPRFRHGRDNGVVAKGRNVQHYDFQLDMIYFCQITGKKYQGRVEWDQSFVDYMLKDYWVCITENSMKKLLWKDASEDFKSRHPKSKEFKPLKVLYINPNAPKKSFHI